MKKTRGEEGWCNEDRGLGREGAVGPIRERGDLERNLFVYLPFACSLAQGLCAVPQRSSLAVTIR
jgi:hypothetical protein